MPNLSRETLDTNSSVTYSKEQYGVKFSYRFEKIQQRADIPKGDVRGAVCELRI